jgi:hypothetical protein
MIRILNVCLVGTLGGPTVWVMSLAQLFLYLSVVSLVHQIIHLVNYMGRARGLIVFATL